MCTLLIVYFVEPSLESPAALAAAENQRLLAWLPSYWFLALFNQLNGSMDPVLVPLARRAWTALGVSALGACAALLLCYFRLMRKMVEQPGILPPETPKSGMGMMTSFGDGISLTPLEYAALIGAVANGGSLYYLQYPRSRDEAGAPSRALY